MCIILSFVGIFFDYKSKIHRAAWVLSSTNAFLYAVHAVKVAF